MEVKGDEIKSLDSKTFEKKFNPTQRFTNEFQFFFFFHCVLNSRVVFYFPFLQNKNLSKLGLRKTAKRIIVNEKSF